MRITILSGSVPTTTFIDAMINVMAEDGYEITVIGKKTGSWDYHQGVTVILLPVSVIKCIFFIVAMLPLAGLSNLVKIWKAAPRLKTFYHNLLFYLPIIWSKPDRIHLQWAAFVHNRDLLFDLYPGKILVSMRGAHINYTPLTTPAIRDSYLRLFPRVRRFHAVSTAIAEEGVLYSADINNTDVIYSFVDDGLLQKPIAQKVPSDVLHIISVGRFFWKKGYEYALDALRILKQQEIAFRYTLIAEGETPASIIYQAHQLGLTDDVHIINGMTHADVIAQIEQHDVLLLPSVEEGIANVVLEAMAVGTPVITTDVGGMKETIDNSVNGFVVPVRNAPAMADALIVFKNLVPSQRYTIATNAKEKLRNRHDRNTFIARFRNFYNS